MADVVSIHRAEYEMNKDEKVAAAEAPGRLVFLGDHCLLGKGVFLGAAINKSVRVAVSRRKDAGMRFYTTQTSERKRSNILNMRFRREDRWANHVKTAICVFADRGYEIPGLNFTIEGDIPQNTGLASSSAVEAASALALKRFFSCPINDKDLLKALAEIHREFYPNEDTTGDFLIMFNAKKGYCVLADEETLSVELIKNPFAKYSVLMVNSKVPFTGTEDELRLRREDLARGLEILRKKHKARSFKDFVDSDPLEIIGELEEKVRRRTMHVIYEFIMLREVAGALKSGDIDLVSHDIFRSHDNLRDFYEVSCPEVDWLVKRASETEGVFAARMSGVGFGSCVYLIIKSDKVAGYLGKMEEYERIFGFHPVHFEFGFGGGVKLLSNKRRSAKAARKPGGNA